MLELRQNMTTTDFCHCLLIIQSHLKSLTLTDPVPMATKLTLSKAFRGPEVECVIYFPHRRVYRACLPLTLSINYAVRVIGPVWPQAFFRDG